MSFTRKHYVEVAEILNRSLKWNGTKEARMTTMDIAADMARMFAADNPRFDRLRFFDAVTDVDS